MAPSNKRKSNTVPDPQDLGKLFLRFKLKFAAVQGGGAAPLRECKRAAEEVESCLTAIERGPPALQLALAQASHAEAKRHLELARQLSEGATSMLLSELESSRFPDDQQWTCFRPLVRLLLWLLPEHIPTVQSQQDLQGSSQSEACGSTSAALTSSTQGQATAADKRNKSTTHAAPGKDWRQQVTLEFVIIMTQKKVLEAIAGAVVGRTSMDISISLRTWRPRTDSAQTVEECLVWITLHSRLYNLALEWEGAACSTVESARTGPKGLSDHLMGYLHRASASLVQASGPVLYWLKGALCTKPSPEPYKQSPPAPQEQQAFAASVKPSKEMATAVGLWDRPVAVLQKLVVLLSHAPRPDLPNRALDQVAYQDKLDAHEEILNMLVPGHRTPLEGVDLEEYERCLPGYVDMHLRGLALMFRLALGCPIKSAVWDSWPGVTSTVCFCMENMTSAALVPASGLLVEAQRYIPAGAQLPNETSPALWELYQSCDDVISAAEQQWTPDQKLILLTAQKLQRVRQIAQREEERTSHLEGWLQHCMHHVEQVQQQVTQVEQVFQQQQQRQASTEQDQEQEQLGRAQEQYRRLREKFATQVGLLMEQQQALIPRQVARRHFQNVEQVLQMMHQHLLAQQQAQHHEGAAEHLQGTLLHDPSSLQPWVRAAAAGAEMLYLLLLVSDAHGRESDGQQQAVSQLYKPALLLMQWLRPTSSTLGTPQARAWAMCLMVVSASLGSFTAWRNEGGSWTSTSPHERAACLRILIDHMLPVLKHVLSPADSTDPASGSFPLPPDVALLLLGAAARILSHCITDTSSRGCDYNILAQGLQTSSSSSSQDTCQQQAGPPAGQEHSRDDLVVFLDVVFSLASALVSGGPLWEEANAKEPLLLLHTLHVTSMSLASMLGTTVVYRHISAVFWRTIGGWEQPRLDDGQYVGGPESAHVDGSSGPEEGSARVSVSSSPAAGSVPANASAGPAGRDASSSGSNTEHVRAPSEGEHDGHNRMPSVCLGRLNSPALAFELSACLLRLVTDKSVVGEAERPAAWLPTISSCAATTSDLLWHMLSHIDNTVTALIAEFCTLAMTAADQESASNSNSVCEETGGDGGSVGSNASSTAQISHATCEQSPPAAGARHPGSRKDSAVMLALQLASLTPHVSCEHYSAAAAVGCHEWGGTEFRRNVKDLLILSAGLQFRVVAMLAIVGKLTEQHKQGVVALLGGVLDSASRTTSGSTSNVGNTNTSTTVVAGSSATTDNVDASNSSSSSNSLLPLPEPASLAAFREENGLTLQDLAMCYLWLDKETSTGGRDSRSIGQLRSMPDHLLLAFGARQLPWVDIMQQCSKASAPPDPQRDNACLQLRNRALQVRIVWDVPRVFEYIRWVSASLMSIINDVLQSDTNVAWV